MARYFRRRVPAVTTENVTRSTTKILLSKTTSLNPARSWLSCITGTRAKYQRQLALPSGCRYLALAVAPISAPVRPARRLRLQPNEIIEER